MTTTRPIPVIDVPTSARRRWAALVVLMLPVLLVSVDNTVLSFALPAISEALHPSGTALLWIVDVYPLLLAGLLVPMGSLGDRVGRRRLLLIGAAGFAAVSALASFAPSASALIALRAGMGVFGAMLMPATLSLIRNIFSDPRERRTAIALWAAAFSGGAALGPIVGGLLLENLWWGSVFLLALPMLVPLFALAPLLVPESRDPRPGPVDPVSIGLVMATMVPFVWAIKTAADGGITLPILAAVGVALIAGIAFVRRQLSRSEPMLDVGLFRVPAFSASISANLLSIFSLVGFLYFLSQHLQLVSDRSPLQSGLLLLPGLVVTILAGLVVVRLVPRLRPSHAMAAGLLMNALGYGIVLVTGTSGSDGALVLAFAVVGAGVGFAETISADEILGAVPARKAGAASAISETAYEAGAVLGTAVLGSILNAAFRAHVEVPSGLSPQAAEAAGQTLGGATEVAARLPGATGSALLDSAREAFDSGVAYTAGVGVALMLIAAAIVLIAMRERRP
ncbi:MFS transporter [Brachybacterium endophyticum]|uniref:MFS transporter n=1 Tax=Brachybacterium endophyticum TaxID=2182385 RepID=A0A2U2RNR6_9MICO|nr:MFS transporter [Brachybacterium endophyticum]PWH07496.1 MFS transporter [Brachybacterium endophyticum]